MKWRQLITDPSSGELSMSRLCFGLVVAGQALGYELEKAGKLLKETLLITAGLYGANSVAGAIRRPEQPPEAGADTRVAGPVG